MMIRTLQESSVNYIDPHDDTETTAVKAEEFNGIFRFLSAAEVLCVLTIKNPGSVGPHGSGPVDLCRFLLLFV